MRAPKTTGFIHIIAEARSSLVVLLWIACSGWLAGACTGLGSPGTQTPVAGTARPSVRPYVEAAGGIQPAPDLATPYAAAPAAGVCAVAGESTIASIEIWPDVPAPRCLQISGEQQLQVSNRTDTAVKIQLVEFRVNLQPGETYTLDIPFGRYLMPGVHRLFAPPFDGPELWLKE